MHHTDRHVIIDKPTWRMNVSEHGNAGLGPDQLVKGLVSRRDSGRGSGGRPATGRAPVRRGPGPDCGRSAGGPRRRPRCGRAARRGCPRCRARPAAAPRTARSGGRQRGAAAGGCHGVVAPAAVSGVLALDAAAHLVDGGEPEPYDMEGVKDPHGVRQRAARMHSPGRGPARPPRSRSATRGGAGLSN